jgi:3',5'-cyclic AMP phosphodiesterase CpdA
MFVLAHLSDPHLAPLPTPRFSDLASKRILGFLNWQRKRRDVHDADTLEAIVADLKRQETDHVAVAGDLINLSLPEEFKAAQRWMLALGSPLNVTLVPGNHDAYVRRMEEEPARRWGDYMRSDGDEQPSFPFVRRRGPVAIVGLSTAVAAPWFRATGKIGKDQMRKLPDILKQLQDDGLFRVVMLHHPPQSEPHRQSERLLNGPEFIAAIKEAGAELVIHGHEHINSVSWLGGPSGRRIPAVGVPSASAAPGHRWEAAGYNIYRIDGTPGAWHCQMTSHGIGEDGATATTDPRVIVWR